MWNKSPHHDLSSRISINWTLKKNCSSLKFMIPHPGLILICHSFKLINEEEEVIKATDSCSFISAATPEAFRAAPQRLHNYYHRHTVVSVFSDGHWPSSAPVLWVCTVKVPAVTSGNQGGKQTVRIRHKCRIYLQTDPFKLIYRQFMGPNWPWVQSLWWSITTACLVWRNTHMWPLGEVGVSCCVLPGGAEEEPPHTRTQMSTPPPPYV